MGKSLVIPPPREWIVIIGRPGDSFLSLPELCEMLLDHALEKDGLPPSGPTILFQRDDGRFLALHVLSFSQFDSLRIGIEWHRL